jgi:hypothetical protein
LWDPGTGDLNDDMTDYFPLTDLREPEDPHAGLPALPDPVGKLPSATERTARKWELYTWLRACWRYAKSIKNNADRILLEKEVETRYIVVLRLFFDELDVSVPRCRNATVDLISGVLTVPLMRQVSQTTRAYTADWENPQFETGAPHVKYLPQAGIPPHLHALYRAQYDRATGFAVSDARAVRGEVEGGDGLVLLEEREGRYWVARAPLAVETSVATCPACIAVDSGIVFVAGDGRVECFRETTLEVCGTLSTEGRVLAKAGVAVWDDMVVLGTGPSLLFWRLADAAGDPSAVHRPLAIQCEIELARITSVSAVGHFLAVASVDYPVAHIYGLVDGVPKILSRLIGHTAGVTSLRPTPDARLFTGSIDTTIQLWSVQDGVLELQFDRHGGPVTAISYVTTEREAFLLTGGGDSMIRAWDCSRKKGMWELMVGDGFIPRALHFDFAEQKLTVLARSNAAGGPSELQVYTFT